jgi:hypothetical protein
MEYRPLGRTGLTTVVGSETGAKVSRNVDWLAEPVDDGLVGDIETLVGPQLNTAWGWGRSPR